MVDVSFVFKYFIIHTHVHFVTIVIFFANENNNMFISRPPFEDTVHATHCLLEQRSVRDYADYIPLAQQGIFLLNTVYISDYLHQPNRDIKECILPYFAKYYSRD